MLVALSRLDNTSADASALQVVNRLYANMALGTRREVLSLRLLVDRCQVALGL